MAGTGYHPEGHWWEVYRGTLAGVKFICNNCALCISKDPQGCAGDCIDDC